MIASNGDNYRAVSLPTVHQQQHVKSLYVCVPVPRLCFLPVLQLLGRADNAKDYIRRGCDRGYVETTLSGGPGVEDHVVRCDLIKSADTYRTEWKRNGTLLQLPPCWPHAVLQA